MTVGGDVTGGAPLVVVVLLDGPAEALVGIGCGGKRVGTTVYIGGGGLEISRDGLASCSPSSAQ